MAAPSPRLTIHPLKAIDEGSLRQCQPVPQALAWLQDDTLAVRYYHGQHVRLLPLRNANDLRDAKRFSESTVSRFDLNSIKDPITVVASSPSGLLFSGHHSGAVRLWDVQGQRCGPSIGAYGIEPVLALCCAQNQIVRTHTDSSVVVNDPRKRGSVAAFQINGFRQTSVSHSLSEELWALAGEDGAVTVYDSRKGWGQGNNVVLAMPPTGRLCKGSVAFHPLLNEHLLYAQRRLNVVSVDHSEAEMHGPSWLKQDQEIYDAGWYASNNSIIIGTSSGLTVCAASTLQQSVETTVGPVCCLAVNDNLVATIGPRDLHIWNPFS